VRRRRINVYETDLDTAIKQMFKDAAKAEQAQEDRKIRADLAKLDALRGAPFEETVQAIWIFKYPEHGDGKLRPVCMRHSKLVRGNLGMWVARGYDYIRGEYRSFTLNKIHGIHGAIEIISPV